MRERVEARGALVALPRLDRPLALAELPCERHLRNAQQFACFADPGSDVWGLRFLDHVRNVPRTKDVRKDPRMNRSETTTADARNVRVASFVAQMKRASTEERTAMEAAIERENMAELERKAITARIEQARREVGLSQPEMAEALHVHERTYQNYESQKKPRVPWGLMNEIATITGKPTEWLIHGDRATTPDLMGAVDGNSQDDAAAPQAQLDRIEQALSGLAEVLDAMGTQNEARAEQFDSKLEALRRALDRRGRRAG
jgi:DNA-binding transcriptional regulator YiaG